MPARPFGNVRTLSAVKEQQAEYGNRENEAVSGPQNNRGGEEPVHGNGGRGENQNDAGVRLCNFFCVNDSFSFII
jgi:hypothetical protein